jgi:hypothetical protein
VTTRADDVMGDFGCFFYVTKVFLAEFLVIEEFAVGLLETDEDGELEEFNQQENGLKVPTVDK